MPVVPQSRMLALVVVTTLLTFTTWWEMNKESLSALTTQARGTNDDEVNEEKSSWRTLKMSFARFLRALLHAWILHNLTAMIGHAHLNFYSQFVESLRCEYDIVPCEGVAMGASGAGVLRRHAGQSLCMHFWSQTSRLLLARLLPQLELRCKPLIWCLCGRLQQGQWLRLSSLSSLVGLLQSWLGDLVVRQTEWAFQYSSDKLLQLLWASLQLLSALLLIGSLHDWVFTLSNMQITHAVE